MLILVVGPRMLLGFNARAITMATIANDVFLWFILRSYLQYTILLHSKC